MQNQKISALCSFSLFAAPLALFSGSTERSFQNTPKSETTAPSNRTSIRRMKHLLATPTQLTERTPPQSLKESEPEAKFDYIHPPLAHHIDSPLPLLDSPEHLLGIYGNILYPQDFERIQEKKLADWITAYELNPKLPFPLTEEELKDLSLFILERFPSGLIASSFVNRVEYHINLGNPLESALKIAKQETIEKADLFKQIAKEIPNWGGRCSLLKHKLEACSLNLEQRLDRHAETIRNNPASLPSLVKQFSIDLIEDPFSWETRRNVFKQMVDKTVALSPLSPYFLALQEVTPQALSDLKTTLADRNLQWISFNNISGKITLGPQQETVLGEATAFTSTLALSPELEVLKVELGDLPTESGSIRKILGVRVRNPHTQEIYNLFTTHTDHQIQNEIYARTALKIHEFANHFFQDASPDAQKFILGGDLNVFEQAGGASYVQKLRELFTESQDFRETDYYAPNPIAWSSFIGRSDDTFSARLSQDGIVQPNALDQLLAGNGVQLEAASRDAAVYTEAGELLDYYRSQESYKESLEKRITFSDHFFNIIRFR